MTNSNGKVLVHVLLCGSSLAISLEHKFATTPPASKPMAWDSILFSSWSGNQDYDSVDVGSGVDVVDQSINPGNGTASVGGRFTLDRVNKPEQLVIFGSGPAGLTAAIYAARANLNPLLVSRDDGQLASTGNVENYPGCGIKTGGSIISSFWQQAREFGARSLVADVATVDFSSEPYQLITNEKKTLRFNSMIIATGATSKRLWDVPGEQKYYGNGIAGCATCEGWFFKGKDVIVIGGGDTAMEEALFLSRICRSVTLVHRREYFRASRIMVDRVLAHAKIQVLYNTTVVEFLGDGLQLTHVVLSSTWEERDEMREVQGAFVAIGHEPNTSPFKGGPLKLDDEGYVVSQRGTHTNLEGVFAAGDVADRMYRQAITSAGLGAMAAMDAERHLCHLGC